MKQRTRKLLTLLLIAAMVMSLMVPALAADTAQSETPYTYDAGDYTFGKISHPNSAPGQPLRRAFSRAPARFSQR